MIRFPWREHVLTVRLSASPFAIGRTKWQLRSSGDVSTALVLSRWIRICSGGRLVLLATCRECLTQRPRFSLYVEASREPYTSTFCLFLLSFSVLRRVTLSIFLVVFSIRTYSSLGRGPLLFNYVDQIGRVRFLIRYKWEFARIEDETFDGNWIECCDWFIWFW